MVGPGSRSVVQIGRAFVLLDGVAAVNDDQLAGDIGGRFGGEKRDSCGNFVGTTGAADGSISTSDDFVSVEDAVSIQPGRRRSQ